MTYFNLFSAFFNIGLFTFGGGYAMLPLIQSQVLKNNWLSIDDLINFVAVSESTPGPFAVNISTYIGAEVGGFFGALCSTIGVTMPSFVIMLLVANYFEKFRKSKIVSGCMTGLKPAVIGLIGAAVVSMAKTAFFPKEYLINTQTCISFIIFVVILSLGLKKVNPIMLIIISAFVGIISGYAINM